jgi:hypothetical protein
MKNLWGDDVAEQVTVESDFWCTPPDLYPVDCFDPCPRNPSFDGLSIAWHGKVFCNPPYSQIASWVDKSIRESASPEVESIVMLLPNWTDREWFQAIKDYKINFLRGRVKFLEPATMAPGKFQPIFGSMLVTIK